jgi:hypothetical protein
MPFPVPPWTGGAPIPGAEEDAEEGGAGKRRLCPSIKNASFFPLFYDSLPS